MGLLRPNWGHCQLAGMMCSRSKKSRGRRAWTVREIHFKKTALVKMLHNRSKHLMVINEVEQPPPHPLKNLFVRITSICDLSNLNTDVTSQITAMTLFLLHDGSRVWGSFIFCFITLFNHFKDPATEWLQPCLLMIPYYQFYALKTCLSLHTSFFFLNLLTENRQIWQTVMASSADARITNIMPPSNPAHKLPALPNLPLT